MKLNKITMGISVALIAMSSANAAFEVIKDNHPVMNNNLIIVDSNPTKEKDIPPAKEKDIPPAKEKDTLSGLANSNTSKLDNKNELTKDNKIVSYLVKEIGKSDFIKNTSFGSNIVLDTALSLIIPSKWQYIASQKTDGKKVVSWEKSNDWIVSLKDIAKQSKSFFLVDWDTKTLMSFESEKSLNDYLSALELKQEKLNTIDKIYSGFGVTTVGDFVSKALPGWKIDMPLKVKNTSIKWEGGKPLSEILKKAFLKADASISIDRSKKIITVYYFTLKEGERLSVELNRWAELEGWKFLWRIDGEDYRIVSDTVFSGGFKRAFYEVIKAYQKNGVLLTAEPQATDYNRTARLKIHKEQ